MLQIYNSLNRQKEPFTPISPGQVRMYVCGMTVYDYCHLGHARVLVVFDVIARYLRASGYKVTYVRNITDIDDKIIRRANENSESIQVLTHRFIDAMHEDAALLGVLPPDLEPCATHSMAEIVEMISTLVGKGFAYQGNNGDVYYDVSCFTNYGRLSGRQAEDLRAGARVEVDEAKDDPLDFVLWKRAKPGEPSWDSPWGAGRPGWHIECSAMSTQCLGEHFDIHGGGMDLMFPHHENEIAQSEAATGHKFVNVWIHNGFVQINEEKMSKSLGNFFTVREVLKQYKPEVVRYFILASHYRSPLNYAEQNLDNARLALERFYTTLRGLTWVDEVIDEYQVRFSAAMDDDFNTPVALAVLFDLAREINRAKETRQAELVSRLAGTLRSLGAGLGILQDDPERFLQSKVGISIPSVELTLDAGDAVVKVVYNEEQINLMIDQRIQARARKDWAESDRIRDELDQQGIILEDGAGGTTWRRR